MKVFPTLQIENGLTVPFIGEPPAQTSPVDMVEQLLDLGCTHVTFIDRDAAVGKGNNRELILKLAHRFVKSAGKVCIQVGGGIRSSDMAQLYLDHGITWILVNAILQRSPIMTEQLVARFQSRLTATLPAFHGQFRESGGGQGPTSPLSRQPSASGTWASGGPSSSISLGRPARSQTSRVPAGSPRSPRSPS